MLVKIQTIIIEDINLKFFACVFGKVKIRRGTLNVNFNLQEYK
jgi:hypothetical protein